MMASTKRLVIMIILMFGLVLGPTPNKLQKNKQVLEHIQCKQLKTRWEVSGVP